MSRYFPPSGSVVETLIRSSWRRRLLVLTSEQLAFALSIVFAGAIAMLLVGTQILNWYWLLLLGVIGASMAAVRVSRRMIGSYRIARLIDDRLELSDTLSTAWFLLAGGESGTPAARFQLQRAEEIAALVQPAAAFPAIGRRAWVFTGALAVVILGLFSVRYLVNSSLSLRPALVPLRFTALASDAALPAAQEKEPKLSHPKSLQGPSLRTSADLLQGAKSQTPLTGSRPKGEAKSPGGSQPSQPGSRTQSASETHDNAASLAKTESVEAAENGVQSQPPGTPGQQERQNTQDGKATDQQQSSGLLDKMKDALSGLMAKMHPNSAAQSDQQDGKSASGEQKGQSPAATAKDQLAKSENGQKAEGAQDAQASMQAAAVEKAPSSVGSSNEETPKGKGSEPQSGAGRQDGQKDIRDAEQLKAMGKLAEIIGKRSASLTGEISVEKPSGQQQLQTQYSNQVGRHTDRGGEINRDEIPLEYQQYVREYMQQVHKEAEAQ